VGNPEDDQNVMITESAIREIYGVENDVSAIFAKTDKGFDPGKVGEDIEDKLRKSRGVKEGKEDFSVQTPEEFLNALNNILAIVNFVLIGIAGISLLVGGIGITNTMYTAVLERTKDIGIMKAIGARNSHVGAIFLIESGMLGLAGGSIGIIIGVGISQGVAYMIRESLGLKIFHAFFPWYLIVGALLFSFVVGCIAGFLPARQASKLRPVEALSYE